MRDVGLESEPSQVRNIEEGHLINVKHEASFVGMPSKWSLRVAGSLSNSKLTLVALLLQRLSLGKGHSVVVLELLVLSKFK